MEEVSEYISKNTCDVLPNIISLHNTQETLHDFLNIPKNSIVFGRYGGYSTFDIIYVHNIIKNVATNFENIYFIFMHTKPFSDTKYKNIIFIDGTSDIEMKTKFINTCDAMIHARKSGETFGMACGEFAIKNKPVFTCLEGDTAHIELLGKSAIIYNSFDLYEKLINFKPNNQYSHNYNKYDIATNIYLFNHLIHKCIINFII
jgi:hypothetical protein